MKKQLHQRLKTVCRILCGILFLFLPLQTLAAYIVTVDDIKYVIYEDGTASVIGNKSIVKENLVIPDFITYEGKNYDVTSIDDSAFSGCRRLSGSLTIGNSVTYIGAKAFEGCSRLSGTLTIGNSVTVIEDNAFGDCSGFTGSLTIPNSVTSIGEYAFYRCSGFTGSLTIPNSVTSIGEHAFYGCSGFIGSLTIPNSVTTIGQDAFCHCSGFTGSLTIGNSVTTIERDVFSGCSGFTGSLTIPNSVTFIGEYAFYGCSGFTGSLIIPNSVTSIGEHAFYGCSGFTGSLTIPNSVTSIVEQAFYGCSGFTGSLTIPNSVTSIGVQAFYGCSGFTGSLTIPNSVTTIEREVFYGCSEFTGSLTIPNSVTSIGQGAFYRCSGFTGSLTIPNSVTSIGERAFQYCSGFTGSLTIPNSVTTIGSRVFADCSGFTGSLTIPNSVTSIGGYAFGNCSGFTGSLTIPNSVTTIESGAFQFCSGFTGTLTIGNSVTTIGYRAFYECSGFTGSLTIGNSVTTIEREAFGNCSGFTGSLTIGNSVTTIGYGAFDDTKFTAVTSLAEKPADASGLSFYGLYDSPLYVPKESITEYKNATGWKNFKYINPISISATSISLNKSELVLNIGEEETLIATMEPESSTAEVIWSVKEEYQNIISVDSEGKVTALAAGEAIVEATAGGVTATCKVTVNPVTASSVTLNVQDITLLVGATDKLTATVSPENVTNPVITWSSDNESIATVDAEGNVTAVAVGVANITAICGDVTAICKVTVNPVPASSVTLNVQDITLLVGATDKLIATVSPENVTNPVITWASDNESIATVDADGNVTAIAVGVANITAKCGDVSATCKVTVESLAERPEAPTQMLRKGNGTSCTFIAMMAMTDTEIEQEGYSFVYGYTDASGNDNVIAKTNVRYCHTTPAVYNNSANDFWVFTVRVDDNGEMIGSERRHLDGSVDDDYDLLALIGNARSINGSDPDNWITATSRGALITVESADAVVVTVCSLGGQVVMRQETAAGTMVSQEINGDIIAPNVYVIRVDCGGKNVSKKVIIR